MRHRVISLIVLTCVALATAGLQSSAPGPIKIGVVHTTTGPLSILGELTNSGIELAFEEIGYTVQGRKVELVFEDDQMRPDTGLTKTKKLIEHDRVNVLLASTSSAVALAIRDYVVSQKTPWIITQAVASSLTNELRAPNIFRVSFNSEQFNDQVARYVHTKLGVKRLVLVGLDYVAGREEVKAFGHSFTAAGGVVVGEYFLPPGVPDQAPIIARIAERLKDADALNATVWGADAIRFMRQAQEFGLLGKTRLITNGAAVEDGMTLPAVGDAALNAINYLDYAAWYDSPMNKRFVERFRQKTGKLPTWSGALGYSSALVAIQALNAVKGNVEDTAGYLAAVRRVAIDTPRGPFRFDENQNSVINMYIRKVAKVDGQLRNVVTDIIPNVRQPRQ